LTLSRAQCKDVLRREAATRRWRSVKSAFSTQTREQAARRRSSATPAVELLNDDCKSSPRTPPGAVMEERSALQSLARLRRNSNRAICGAGGAREASGGERGVATPGRHGADMERAIQLAVRMHASGRQSRARDGYSRFNES